MMIPLAEKLPHTFNIRLRPAHSFHPSHQAGDLREHHPYRNKYCRSSRPGCFVVSTITAHVPTLLFISQQGKKTLLNGWMVGKLQHNTHLHCRAGSERNFFQYRGSEEQRKKEIGCVSTEQEKKFQVAQLSRFARSPRDQLCCVCFGCGVRFGDDVQCRFVRRNLAANWD